MKWFRWYRGAAENSKFAMIAEMASNPSMSGEGDRVRGAVSVTDVIATWAVILEDAACKEHWGTCIKNAKFISLILRWFEEEVESVLETMCEYDLLEKTAQGYKVLKWEEYQYSSDTDPTNAERQKRYRDKVKQTRNASVTRTDTEADTDTEEEKKEVEGASDDATPPKPKLEKGKRLEAYLAEHGLEQTCKEWGEWSLSQGMSVQAINDEMAKFRDYWKAVSGGKGCKADWPATWRNWSRRALETIRREENRNAVFKNRFKS